METIIYIYPASGEETRGQSYCSETFLREGYRLIRLGMSPQLWRLMRESETTEDFSELQKVPAGKGLLKRRRRMRCLAREQREKEVFRHRFVEEVLTDPCHMSIFCRWQLPCLDSWSFRGYLEDGWVRYMMRHAETFRHLVILGKGECLSGILADCARRLKSLTWILPRRYWGQEQQELTLELEEEYGLAAVVRLREEEDYGGLRLGNRVPVAVLDLTGQERLTVEEVPEGSVWIDMLSRNAKRIYLENRGGGFSYYSLEKEWERPIYQLDTGDKSVYNTES